MLTPFSNRTEYFEQNESEIVVSIFRTLVLILLVVTPRFAPVVQAVSPDAYVLIIFAAVYNLLTTITFLRQIDLPFRRHAMVITDMCLVTLWISVSPGEKRDLFPLYQLVTIIAAIWFKVLGAVVVASFASFSYILIYVTSSLDPLAAFQQSLTLHIPFLYLVALLSGYLAEAQEWERSRRIETQLLVSDYEREMSMSRDIQKLMLPGRLPKLPGVDLSAMTRVARVVGGGDYYDLARFDDHQFGLCIADVAGKSIRAQIRLPLLKYAFRAVAPIYREPVVVVRRLNEMVYEDLQPEMFIAICYALVDVDNNTARLCIAGHSPPLRFPAGENPYELLPTGGLPLGVDVSPRYEEVSVRFTPGDALLFYTDGVNHARNSDGEEFSEDCLAAIFTQNRQAAASRLSETLLKSVDEFEHGVRGDDLTILVLKREGR